MNNKQQFDFFVDNGILKQKDDTCRVELLANRLIESLYIPSVDHQLFTPNWNIIKDENIDKDEPINWGDLKATVCKKEGLYIVTIDEASPGGCQTLCDFIEKYLTAWGWPVIINTEW